MADVTLALLELGDGYAVPRATSPRKALLARPHE